MSSMPVETVNPFTPSPDRDTEDCLLVERALSGDRGALETLLCRHQPWIYNLAFRMVMVPQEAEDVTQEVLIKVLTKLSTFDRSKAAFRTWLYRIVANYVINMKKRGYEAAINRIEDYYSFVAKVPDQDPDTSPETRMVIADIAIGCVMGVFLCLERDQRLAFILAVGFNVSDAVGSEILEMTPAGFRKLLSRARARLHEYVQGNCSLMNPDAPCHCSKKVLGFMKGGYGQSNLTFLQGGAPKLAEVVEAKVKRFNREIYWDYARLLREHPFYRAPEVTSWLRALVQRPEFKDIFELGRPGD